jgi:hypothetical protein
LARLVFIDRSEPRSAPAAAKGSGILSDKAIKRLDRFSKDHELSRARVLEVLLQMEDENDLYLKEQIRVLQGINA